MTSSYVAILLGIGLIAGVASGIFGIGGGLVVIPLLVLLLQMPQATANGTSLVALLLPVGILGVLTYYRSGKIGPDHLKAGLLIATGIFFGTYFGAKIAVSLSNEMLRRVFAIFLVCVAVRLWFR